MNFFSGADGWNPAIGTFLKIISRKQVIKKIFVIVENLYVLSGFMTENCNYQYK